MNSSPSLHRRNFLRTGALATIAGVATSRDACSQALGDEPIQVGMITNRTIPYIQVAIALAAIPGVRVRAVTNLVPAATRHLGRVFTGFENPNVGQYSDYREMLDQEPELDAVIILTPQWLRAQQCIDCLHANKHVYVLPPVGNDLEAVQVLARHAQGLGRVLQVGYHRRSLPHYRLVKERLIAERGILDPILNANVTWRHSSLIDGRLAVPKKTLLHVPLEVLKANGYESMESYSNWRRQRRFSIGPLGGLPAHFIDTLLWLFQGNPHTITATGKNLHKRLGDVYTQFHITLEFGQGDSYGVANLQLLDDASVMLPSEVFVGEGMTLLLSDQANQQNFLVEHRFGESNDWRDIAKAEGLNAVTPSNVDLLPQAAAAIYTYTRPTAFYRLPLGEQRRLEQPHLEDFFVAIREGRAPRCSLAEAYRAEVVLHKILEAVETQVPVRLTPADYDLNLL